MITANSERYLGDILSTDGKIEENLKKRQSKGIGIVNQIIGLLGGISFGNSILKWPSCSEIPFSSMGPIQHGSFTWDSEKTS